MNGQVSLWRLPRSGSTMLWRCLEIAGVKIDQGPKFAHNLFTPIYSPLILTVRDFRDVALSQARIHARNGLMHVESGIDSTLLRIQMLDMMAHDNPGATIWRYEEHWHNPLAMCRFIEREASVRLSMTQAADIYDAVSPDVAMALAAGIPVTTPDRPFLSYDKTAARTHIHHAHLGPSKGEPEAWRRESDETKALLAEKLSSHLERWGYPCR